MEKRKAEKPKETTIDRKIIDGISELLTDICEESTTEGDPKISNILFQIINNSGKNKAFCE